MKTKTNTTTATSNAAKFSLAFLTLSARSSKSAIASVVEDIPDMMSKTKALVAVASLPDTVTDETIREEINAADAAFTSAEHIKGALYKRQAEAMKVWIRHLGLDKAACYARAKGLLVKANYSENHAASEASKACALVGFAKDEKKVKARAARTAKAKAKAKGESLPIAQALKEYAMKALKDKSKARAALLAAAALIK